jgi:phosphoglycerate kinase
MKSIQTYNFKHQKALIRVDFNVPLDKNYQITDTIRIDKAIPSIRQVLDNGGAVILLSHLGRPKQGYQEDLSLTHLVPYLSNQLNTPIDFAKDCIGMEAQEKANKLQPGQVLLLENLRFHAGEEKGDPVFAQALAKLGDIYINDAFGVAHRSHASVTTITQYLETKLAGYLLQEEVKYANHLIEKPRKPFTAIIGGAKISDKIQTIVCLLDKIDHLLIGGGVANTFHQALGGQLGNSLVETDQLDLARDLLSQARAKGVKLLLPVDVIAANKMTNLAKTTIVASNNIPTGFSALDIGPQSQKAFGKVIESSQTILWSGPMGIFELARFIGGTQTIASAVVKATKGGAFSIIGGGDSASAIRSLRHGQQVSYISTGGGALLAYIGQQSLPGIHALQG